MTAPEPYLSACMAVLSRAIVMSRVWCWEKSASHEHLADIMDAIHNIPYLVTHWETCDVELLRLMLGFYEQRWADRGGVALLKIFDDAIRGESS